MGASQTLIGTNVIGAVSAEQLLFRIILKTAVKEDQNGTAG